MSSKDKHRTREGCEEDSYYVSGDDKYEGYKDLLSTYGVSDTTNGQRPIQKEVRANVRLTRANDSTKTSKDLLLCKDTSKGRPSKNYLRVL